MQALSLCDINLKECAEVIEIDKNCPLRRRLFDIGLTPGAQVLLLGKSPLGDPAAYLIRGAVYAIRRADAKYIKVKRLEAEYGTDK